MMGGCMFDTSFQAVLLSAQSVALFINSDIMSFCSSSYCCFQSCYTTTGNDNLFLLIFRYRSQVTGIFFYGSRVHQTLDRNILTEIAKTSLNAAYTGNDILRMAFCIFLRCQRIC